MSVQPLTSLPWGPEARDGLEPVSGGVTAVDGVRAGGVASGVKPSGRADLALVVTDDVAATAVVTTKNLVKASACRLTERHAADGRARAIVINSGNANVATPQGEEHTHRLAAATAAQIGAPFEEVLVMSTGVIGVPLPIGDIEAALPAATADLTPEGGHRAAQAMLTTDTRTKEVAYRVSDDAGGSCTIAGMAKGVGMIEPAMATLLVVLTTDAPLGGPVLRRLLQSAVGATFNRISVDGDGSTSDTAAVLATSASPSPPGLESLARGFEAVCADLAHAVISDGEGASRVAAITVHDAPTEAEAEQLARAVATSLLVRAAIHGGDPNWGRILMAMGNAGVDFDPGRVSVRCGGVTVCRFGVATAFDPGQVAVAMAQPEITLDIGLGIGQARATMLTCDLTPEYVRFNADYTT